MNNLILGLLGMLELLKYVDTDGQMTKQGIRFRPGVAPGESLSIRPSPPLVTLLNERDYKISNLIRQNLRCKLWATVTSSTNPEVHNEPQRRHKRTTEPTATGNTHRKFHEVCYVVFIREQTDRQTDRLIAILCALLTTK